MIDLEKLRALRCELARASEHWQFNLLDPQQLCQFARQRSITIFDGGTVAELWRVGLLRADRILATSKLAIPSLELVSEEDEWFVYCDTRHVEFRAKGYGGSIVRTDGPPTDLRLWFHPFRLYVLYHIDRVFRSNLASTQFLLWPEGLVTLPKSNIDFLNLWTASEKFVERFEHWNKTSELAIVLEPGAHSQVFHEIRWRDTDTQESIEAKLREWQRKTDEFLTSASATEIDEIRNELCREAELLDDNKLVHVLLRLMKRHERHNLRSAIGACMLFLTMAEVIRRSAERSLGQKLPEEDELGFGQWMDGARKSIYGSDRILDAPRETQRDFLASMGLERGVKVRCYVEGDTELGALISAVGDAGGLEFVNLRGQVVERQGKGLSFVTSLKTDMKSHVFSVVVLDGDRTDVIRALKKAAADGAFFGRFFISSPDFEFANFSLSELVNVLLELTAADHDPPPTRDQISQLVDGAASNKALFDALKQSELRSVSKSERWGAALMKHALQHRNLPSDHNRAGATRPIIEVAQLLIRARDAGYLRSLEGYEVDPETGELQKKQANSPPSL